jgi:tetratricopeptide (TPR) repeat protein
MVLRDQSKWAAVLFASWLGLAAWAQAAPSSYGESPSADASASAAPAASASASARTPSPTKLDPKGKTGLSPQMVKLLKGHAAYGARDFAGAAAVYREAIADNPNEPSAYYFLGQAELAAGHPADAEATYQKGLKNAASSDEWRTKLHFVIAELREGQGRFADARKAWEEVIQAAAGYSPLKASADAAVQRIRAIDKHLQDQTHYGAVKQRIEQRLKEAGASPPDEGPRPPAKPKK